MNTKNKIRINILKPGGLAKSDNLKMDKTILNSIQFLYVIYDIPTCLNTKVSQAWGCLHDGLRHVKSSLGLQKAMADNLLITLNINRKVAPTFLKNSCTFGESLSNHVNS
jgi:hypothetical protein